MLASLTHTGPEMDFFSTCGLLAYGREKVTHSRCNPSILFIFSVCAALGTNHFSKFTFHPVKSASFSSTVISFRLYNILPNYYNG